jgi:hypothetical protein
MDTALASSSETSGTEEIKRLRELLYRALLHIPISEKELFVEIARELNVGTELCHRERGSDSELAPVR